MQNSLKSIRPSWSRSVSRINWSRCCSLSCSPNIDMAALSSSRLMNPFPSRSNTWKAALKSRCISSSRSFTCPKRLRRRSNCALLINPFPFVFKLIKENEKDIFNYFFSLLIATLSLYQITKPVWVQIEQKIKKIKFAFT